MYEQRKKESIHYSVISFGSSVGEWSVVGLPFLFLLDVFPLAEHSSFH